MTSYKPFPEPIYVTRPLLPPLEEFTERLKDIWDSQMLTNLLGTQHTALESQLQAKLRVPYVSLFNNGTIALIVACQSLRLSGEVITTPFTFAATPHVLTWNNIKPIFCDIDPETLTIDVNKIESLITPQTTAIMGVHVYGTPCEVEKIQELAHLYGLRVIYDAAHAFGVNINGRGIGTYGDISMFSFHATKLFHTAEGGCLTYQDEHIQKRVMYLKNFGFKSEEEVMMPGINGKMNEIQAALGVVVLRYVEAERQKRKLLTRVYRHSLKGVPGITFVTKKRHSVRANYTYAIIRVDKKQFGISRDELHEKLKEYNVITRKYFYPLCSNYACYNQLPSARRHNLPVANQVAREVLSLPLYGQLTSKDIEKISAIIKKLKKRASQN